MQPSSTPLRVGVVGLGWAGETHVKAYQLQPNVKVTAWAGLEDDRREQLGALYNVPNLFAHWEELVASDEIDAVSIASPNFLHAPIAIAALERGKHVLCEKPLARTGPEAEQMVQASIKANRVLMTSFNRRHRGDMQVVKRSIDEGKLGRIYYAKAYWMRRNGIPGMGGWFTNSEMAGGGPLIDLGVHVLDMALYLMGEPEITTVSASTYAEFGPRGFGGRGDQKTGVSPTAYNVEDLATAFIRMRDGATLLLEASWATHSSASDDFGVILYGSEGGAAINVVNYTWDNTLRIYTNVGGVPAEIAPDSGKGDDHVGVIRDFVGAIRGGNWSAYDGSEGMTRARVIDACYASAKQGREVLFGEQR